MTKTVFLCKNLCREIRFFHIMYRLSKNVCKWLLYLINLLYHFSFLDLFFCFFCLLHSLNASNSTSVYSILQISLCRIWFRIEDCRYVFLHDLEAFPSVVYIGRLPLNLMAVCILT